MSCSWGRHVGGVISWGRNDRESNLTLSKINKSVVTVRIGHLMNSVFVNPGIFSCAVDAFMEISTHLFLPYLSNLRTRNEFRDLLFSVCSHIVSLREKIVHC